MHSLPIPALVQFLLKIVYFIALIGAFITCRSIFCFKLLNYHNYFYCSYYFLGLLLFDLMSPLLEVLAC